MAQIEPTRVTGGSFLCHNCESGIGTGSYYINGDFVVEIAAVEIARMQLYLDPAYSDASSIAQIATRDHFVAGSTDDAVLSDGVGFCLIGI